MSDVNDGKVLGGGQDSGGVNPELPIGPGNPPASGVIQPGEVRNAAGWPKGKKHSKTVMRAIYDNDLLLKPGKLRTVAANIYGVAPDQVSNRELIMITQAHKAITKADTPAATFCTRVAGEMNETVTVIPTTTVKLDDVTQAEVEAAMKKILAEEL